MDRDLDLLTALLLDPFLTTNEAVCEAAARRGVRQGERPDPKTWLPERTAEFQAPGK